MYHRTLLGAFALAAGFTAAIAVKIIKDKMTAFDEEEDSEINFIKIKDDDKEYSDAVKELCAVYPYLDAAFIDDLLHQNEELNKKYEPDTLITISHKIVFDDDEKETRFREILRESGYDDKKEMNAVVVKKNMYTENNAIISDVLNVANQALALNGQYLEYRTEA